MIMAALDDGGYWDSEGGSGTARAGATAATTTAGEGTLTGKGQEPGGKH